MNQTNYKHQVAPIGKLQPDKNQPRSYFDEETLEAMAVSIKNEGVINAIEVDKNFIIITGEQRWRAAQLAGLKEVPVKVLEAISEKERFIRQMQENLSRNTMGPMETAKGFDKIRGKWLASTTAALARDKFHKGNRYQKGIKELHEIFGLPETTIITYLNLLEEKDPEMVKALKNPKFQMSKVGTINSAPKKYQKKLRHIAATQVDLPRDTVRHMAAALSRAERYGEVEKATELLNQNFEGMRTLEALRKINKIVPDEESRLREPADTVKFISGKVIEFMDLLDEHPLESFDEVHRSFTVRDLNFLGFYLQNYLQGKDMKNMKITKTKLIGQSKG